MGEPKDFQVSSIFCEEDWIVDESTPVELRCMACGYQFYNAYELINGECRCPSSIE